jgi:hypothetical protein
MPAGFDFPSREAEMWVPATIAPSKREDFTGGYLSPIGRLKEGVRVEQARAEVLAVAREIRSRIPRAADDYGQGARVVPLKDEMVDEIQPMLLVAAFALIALILGAVGVYGVCAGLRVSSRGSACGLYRAGAPRIAR